MKAHKFEDHPPCQEKFPIEGTGISGTAKPLNSQTDRELEVSKPYNGSFGFGLPQFEHRATPRGEDKK